MAEVAAGALAAEQVIMTGIEAGAAVAVAKPTQPLKASLNQITIPVDDQKVQSDLARTHHTVTCIGNRAFIFGGQLASGQLCNTDVHTVALSTLDTESTPANPDGYVKVPDTQTYCAQRYSRYPAFPLKDATTGETLLPAPRTRHAATARGDYILIHGGLDASGTATSAADNGTENPATIWLWDSGSLKWARINATVQIGATFVPRWDHAIFVDQVQDILILHGGHTETGLSAETWLYDFNSLTWTELPSAPVASLASNIAYSNGTLFSVSGGDGELGGSVHFLKLGHSSEDREKPLAWETVDFPANPLTPGPRFRTGGTLLPVTTGFGRRFLVYMFGSTEKAATSVAGGVGPSITSNSSSSSPAQSSMLPEHDQPLYSDIWSLQLPSEGFTASTIKDAIRDRIPGVNSGAMTWSEVEVLPNEMVGHEGKAHPGPVAFFGAAGCLDGKGVFFWGGASADRMVQDDGWLVKIS
ncbi:uncharacterized protein PgNI_00625 [Pyricularia grisea]|uniref:Uncharacterized protein n=1 Tax=Pyricularia grisea TaxID=148305 RepID=A0A6P8BI35_PYRGI|nr:uncharacterized protein PgNI_00625 [Pyricularia grisea]TLD16375.1 hypothetical protein PgNI_00625 [Pyricularia grisea]